MDDIAGDGWNSANTVTWFKTQAGISASSSDENYYLYYGNSGETQSPPANMSDSMGADTSSDVFWYADDFEERGYDIVRYDLETYSGNKHKIADCEYVFIAALIALTSIAAVSSVSEPTCVAIKGSGNVLAGEPFESELAGYCYDGGSAATAPTGAPEPI